MSISTSLPSPPLALPPMSTTGFSAIVTPSAGRLEVTLSAQPAAGLVAAAHFLFG